jgi:hypothetical protein
MSEMNGTPDVEEPRSQFWLAVGLVLAASIALASFFFTVAPAGLETDPSKAATYKQVTAGNPK